MQTLRAVRVQPRFCSHYMWRSMLEYRRWIDPCYADADEVIGSPCLSINLWKTQ
jgi:hypothetical protein